MRWAKTVTVLALLAAISAIWLVSSSPASGAGAGRESTGARAAAVVETLVRYCSIRPRFPVGPVDCHAAPRRLALTRKPSIKLCKSRPAHCLIYRGMCTADCRINARTTLVLPGPNIGPVLVGGNFQANGIFESYIALNSAARAAIKRNPGKVRLRTRITALDLTTGDTDVDRRTFRIKHG